MKTTDGHEAIKGQHYFSSGGQSVILEEVATTEGGKTAFLVIPIYEGEAMSANCDVGSHSEITIDYEHEGEPTLIKSLFKKAPMDRLDAAYKAELDRIGWLSVAFGEIKKILSKVSADRSEMERIVKELSKTIEKSKEDDLQARKMLESTTELVNKKRQELSVLEDSIGALENSAASPPISAQELQRLNKADFKLGCLEAGGVDNWEWYSDSLDDFRERYPEG